ncbi:thioredoxin family protein [Ancylomarina sp. 16SWW S1-10-2]|uniref:thioredoxin family protein n=1 Tax=Ancylomarina sp. 16SWW S1-10-2 TaxID=2499681 RepID=UPI0012AEA5DC|nr:thioredoxin family protein [Ancylomarina sp. 16SWW S1-10-2]MRT94666.1 thioredoxin [Ancylomarina sp. 16SWW S1-10-2]
MKNLLTVITIALSGLFISTSSMAQNRSVEFEHAKWSKVLKKAKKENKLIFVDCYTSWCGPCKMMTKDVFTQDHVADYFNSNFVNFKVDMEKGEGPSLKPGWKINAYPTFLVINADGEVIHRVVGAYQADEFINYMKEAQSDDKNFAALQKQYEAGKRDGEFMFSYLRSLRMANLGKEESKRADEYISSLNKEDLLKKENWNIVKYFMNNPATDEFRFVVKNRTKLADIVGADEINSKIYNTYNKTIEQYSYFQPRKGRVYDKKGFDTLITDLQNSNFEKSSELIAIALRNEYSRLNDWDKYAYVVDAALDFSLLKNNENKLSFFDNAAAMIANVSKDKEILEKALRWADYASVNEDRVQYKSGYLATKANLLELVGNAEAAKATQSASEEADLKAEKDGTKIISIPMMKLGGMQPIKGKKK